MRILLYLMVKSKNKIVMWSKTSCKKQIYDILRLSIIIIFHADIVSNILKTW